MGEIILEIAMTEIKERNWENKARNACDVGCSIGHKKRENRLI
jgi:hypothetical protein